MAAKPETLFIRACSAGRVETVESLLQQGMSPDTQDKYGLSGLIWAGRKGQVEVAKALLERGADIESQDRRGRTALFHAVAYKRLAFVEFLIEKGAQLNTVDAHGWTALDLATMPLQPHITKALEAHGAQRKATQAPMLPKPEERNRFYCGGAIGGPNLPVEVMRIQFQLSGLMYKWRGDYTDVAEVIDLALYVDGSAIRYTEQMKLIGVGKVTRSKTWIYAKIGVPESWWREDEPAYKLRLTGAIEEALHKIIDMLKRNKHTIREQQLLADWEKRKHEFLSTPAPPFPAEKQHTRIRELVDEIVAGKANPPHL